MVNDVTLQVITDKVRVPVSGRQQPLHPAGVPSPARSDSVQEFFRSSVESNPRTYAIACSRGSDLVKRRPIRLRNCADPSAHSCTSATHRSSPITAESTHHGSYQRRHADKSTTVVRTRW